MIQLASSRYEIEQCFPIMLQLRPHLKQGHFVELVQQQMHTGYQLAYLTKEDLAIAIAGYNIANSLSWGKYFYLADFIVDEKHRAQGYGAQLFSWLIQTAKNNFCQQFHLDSGVQRFTAHRFYLKQKMNITSHHFCICL